MSRFLDKARDLLDSYPLWFLIVAAVFLTALAVYDLLIRDMIPVLDELTLALLAGATLVYLWGRMLDGPRTPGAREVRSRMRDIERLAHRLGRTAKALNSEPVQAQVDRMQRLLPRARDVAQRLLALEVILARPEYQKTTADSVVERIQREIDATADAGARRELEAALRDAQAHADNLEAVRAKGAAMRASLERVRQLFRRAESKVIAGTVGTGTEEELAETVDTLDTVLDEMEAAREEVASATRGGSAEFAAKVRQLNEKAGPH